MAIWHPPDEDPVFAAKSFVSQKCETYIIIIMALEGALDGFRIHVKMQFQAKQMEFLSHVTSVFGCSNM